MTLDIVSNLFEVRQSMDHLLIPCGFQLDCFEIGKNNFQTHLPCQKVYQNQYLLLFTNEEQCYKLTNLMLDIVKWVISNSFRSQMASSQDIHLNFNLSDENRDCWFQSYTRAMEASISLKLHEFLMTIKKMKQISVLLTFPAY